MINLKIENRDYNMPTSWDEITIKKYIEIQRIIEQKLSPMKELITMISIMSDVPLEILYTIDLEDFGKLDFSWISQTMKGDVKRIIEIDGIKYGMVKDMKKLSLGEYVDLDYYQQNINENMHLILSVLMRPIIQEDGELYIIEKYDTNTIEERANIFLEKMSISQLSSVSDFFLSIGNGFLKNMKTSSQ